mmetsp:Transcript_30723/g.67283  ORF Transcript_30723/g.67283 Transcript_30723/m.67283 type:complete len:224 (-) Transcript_30723:284-955(-)
MAAPLFSTIAQASSFWVGGIVDSKIGYILGKGLLPRLSAPHEAFVAIDGGTADTFGLYPLLRRKLSRVVAFVDDTADLNTKPGSLGFLFGAAGRTTRLAMWQGPTLAQVFPSELWPAVLSNLTGAERPFAYLRNVPVLQNDFLGVESYRLESLLLITMQRSEAFLAEFDRVDPQLRQRLHAGWPQQLPVLGLSALDTNALCVYAGWSVVQHQELIRGAHHANH